jgi:hypothetical protein
MTVPQAILIHLITAGLKVLRKIDVTTARDKNQEKEAKHTPIIK